MLLIACFLTAAAPTVKKASDVTYKTILAGKGKAAVLLELPGFAVDVLEADAGAEVTSHTHKGSAEILYIIEGEATTTVDGTAVKLVTGDSIVIPADTPHSAVFHKKTRCVQLYAPPGPEQRFK